MASDETMTFHSSLQDEDFDDDIIDDGFDHNLQHQHPHNLSRLSVCTNSTLGGADDEDDVDNAMTMYVSRLSLESSFGDGDGDDADGEVSDGKEEGLLLLSSDSGNEEEDEVGSCYSLPATPPRRRSRVAAIGAKDYASDNEAEKGKQRTERNDERRRRRRRNRRVKRVFDREMMSKKKEEHVGGFSGDSDQSAGTGTGTGVVLITRPKGGKRALCMGLEEVKACRDLGFELEHERMLEMPSSSSSRLSLEATSSGGNSPIANWRISAPGDDPRDVKARLKVWAQAVALASASKYST